MEENKIILDAFALTMPGIKDLFLGDCAIGCSNLEKYLCYVSGNKMDHKIRPGDPVKEGGLSNTCIKNKKSVFVEVGPQVFGFAYTGMATPIYNHKRELIGTFFVLESMEMKESRDKLREISNNINTNMAKLNKNMDLLLNQAENINSSSIILKDTSDESTKQVDETNEVLSLIKNIANKTNLLGINASIESTRVGKEGAGFKVVSDEIRGLSMNTNKSIDKIEPIIKQVHANSKSISEQISSIAGNTSSIIELINQTRNMGGMLKDLSDEIDILADQLTQISQRT